MKTRNAQMEQYSRQRQVIEAVEISTEMSFGPATLAARFPLEVMLDVFGAAGHVQIGPRS